MARSRALIIVLALSLAVNVAAVAFVVNKARHNGGLHYFTYNLGLDHPPTPNFPLLGRERFGVLPRSTRDVVFAGDSEIQNAPLADLVTNVKQRGIGGETVAQVHSWIGQILHPRPRRIVLLAGVNDAIAGRPPAEFAADYRSLLNDVHRQAPQTRMVVLTVPPARPLARQYNAELRTVTRQCHANLVDIYTPLADPAGRYKPGMTTDGTHLTAAGYARIAPLLRSAMH